MDFYRSGESCLGNVNKEKNRSVVWSPPSLSTSKFNVDGIARGRSGPVGIGGVLHNKEEISSLVFSELMGVRDSNDAELLGIRKGLLLWERHGHGELIIEGDSFNAIKWTTGKKKPPWN